LVAGELVVRAVWTPPSAATIAPGYKHPVYRSAPRPGAAGTYVTPEFSYEFSHTEQGLRGNKVFGPQLDDRYRARILFLGDSYTYGVGSDDGAYFVALVDYALADVEVVNGGSGGLGTRDQLAVLDQLGAALQPDYVVLVMFWNDLENNMEREWPRFALVDGKVRRSDMVVPEDFDPLALQRIDDVPARQTRPLHRTYIYKLYKEGLRGFRHRVFGVRTRDITTQAERDAAWEVTRQLLTYFKLRSDEIGAQLVLVTVPDYALVSERGSLKGQNELNFDIEPLVQAFADDAGVIYLNPLQLLSDMQAATDEPFYYQIDRHLTPLGNRALADVLTPALENILAGAPAGDSFD